MLTYLLQVLLSKILRPGYIGTFIWLMLAVHFFIGGVFDLKRASDFNKQLSETVCVINGAEPLGCMNVSYVANQKAYTGNARMPFGCFSENYMLETFHVNKKYYCWYSAKNPDEVYLDKDTGNRTQVSVTLIVILFCIIRFIYLFLSTKYIKPDLSSPVHQTKNTCYEKSQTNAVNDDKGFNILHLIPSFTLLGILLGIGLMMNALFSYSYKRYYTVKPCEVIDVVKISDKAVKANVSYPVKDLVYTTTTYLSYNIGVNPDNVKIGPAVCMYDSDHPHMVYLTTPTAALWDDLKEGLFPFTLSTLLLLLLPVIALFVKYLFLRNKK